MKKNNSGQKIGVQMVSATDGSAFTGSVTVAVTGDAGTQATGSVGSGACTHEGNGYHTYAPAQAETNYDLIAFTFTGSGAVPATVQVYTLPTTGILAPATADRTLVVDASGLADANVVKLGPTGSGTAQTAKDLGAINVTNLNTLSGHDPGATLASTTNITAGTITTVGTLTTYAGNTPQTGDAYARLGAPAGASVSADIAAIAADNPNTPTKNVAFSNFVFMMVDATDFNTPETGVTVTATISKDGGSFASCANAVSEISGGFYKINLTQTEMNADTVALKFTGTGCAQRNFVFRTQPT